MMNPDNPTGIPAGAGMEGAAGAAMLLPAIGSIYDTYQSSQTAKRNTDKTIAANKAEAALAYQRSVQMWHLQNQYNSPEEQMKRFGAAGLNPHLIYSQGNPGNASGTPQYNPPNLQYKYAAPAYGAAVGSVLPTLMAVGSWMQNMRMSEVEIQNKQTSIQKAEQLIEFLEQKNPREISKLDNTLTLFPYQQSMMEANSKTAWATWNKILHENQHLYGLDGQSGMRAIERAKMAADARLRGLQADWYSPAAIAKMVLGGVGALSLRNLGRASTGKINPRRRQTTQEWKTDYRGRTSETIRETQWAPMKR